MRYIVKTFHDAGLEAKWSRASTGKPIIVVREPGDKRWLLCDRSMWSSIQQHGVESGYNSHAVLSDFFFISGGAA